MSKNNREEAQLLAIWKKALEAHPGHLELRFTHSSNATSIRLKLYHVIKPFRLGEVFDAELEEAADKLMIRVEKRDNGHFVVFLPKTMRIELDEALRSIGIEVEDVEAMKTAAALEAETSLQKLLELRENPSTPFYER